ncbi:hypothetical protein B0I35DRAFT_517354 [Stachybotrys elegans]|uniref:Uncharacterized protein n=1 Tax=Stachybotrys elegans TaxID=80388 RepID=A0A8K0SH04_9HYPO|nr:hypothetical protein B0I35DRAFT_517354 [Stachybotrys elegans]
MDLLSATVVLVAITAFVTFRGVQARASKKLPPGPAINHDPDTYKSPHEFLLERYETNSLGYRKDVQSTEGRRKAVAFGAGRLICPGQHLAENSLIINVTKIIWAIDITPGIHAETGQHLKVEDTDDSIETQWTNDVLTAPKPFPVSLVIRSPEHQTVVDNEYRQAQSIFKEYE